MHSGSHSHVRGRSSSARRCRTVSVSVASPPVFAVILWCLAQIELPQHNAYKCEEKLRAIKKQLDDQIVKRVRDECEMEDAEQCHRECKDAMFQQLCEYRRQMSLEYSSLPERWNSMRELN